MVTSGFVPNLDTVVRDDGRKMTGVSITTTMTMKKTREL
jgi:hypothetical protein